jgi:hypothetical protein
MSFALEEICISELLLGDVIVPPLDLGRREGGGSGEEGTASPATKLEAALDSLDGASLTGANGGLDTGSSGPLAGWWEGDEP